jgi:hypothetical protein
MYLLLIAIKCLKRDSPALNFGEARAVRIQEFSVFKIPLNMG